MRSDAAVQTNKKMQNYLKFGESSSAGHFQCYVLVAPKVTPARHSGFFKKNMGKVEIYGLSVPTDAQGVFFGVRNGNV